MRRVTCVCRQVIATAKQSTTRFCLLFTSRRSPSEIGTYSTLKFAVVVADSDGCRFRVSGIAAVSRCSSLLSTESAQPCDIHRVMSLKGKTANRGWASLPPDVIRCVSCAFHLGYFISRNRLVISQLIMPLNQFAVPSGWTDPQFWPNRIMFTALHTAVCIQPYIGICRSWKLACESSLP